MTHLRKTINEFIEDLKTVFIQPDEICDMEVIELLLMALPDSALHDRIKTILLPYKAQITSRDDKYFISNCAKIFEGLPANRVDHFVGVIKNPKRVDAETRGVIFDYLCVLISLVDLNGKNTKTAR